MFSQPFKSVNPFLAHGSYLARGSGPGLSGESVYECSVAILWFISGPLCSFCFFCSVLLWTAFPMRLYIFVQFIHLTHVNLEPAMCRKLFWALRLQQRSGRQSQFCPCGSYSFWKCVFPGWWEGSRRGEEANLQEQSPQAGTRGWHRGTRGRRGVP